ncbi:MAG TPA: TIGR02757 family protein [Tenuifilaceae bacterium]|nr:TIGR02757 family protein [Tenuifilaceae bacterium]
MLSHSEVNSFLEEKYRLYASPSFIEHDPIQIPHRYSAKEDIEIAGFLTASLAWGQRTMIIRSAGRLLDRMGESPYEFILNATNNEIEALSDFYYRTFKGTDCVVFLRSLQRIYLQHDGLERVFTEGFQEAETVASAISYFRNVFTGDSFPKRSEKHISNPQSGSAAKRLNMYLRWMVRPKTEGVDFGIWREIPPSALMLPLDVHTSRVARALGLLSRKQNDWKAVEEVTQNLRTFDPTDPVKYDFALFGLGAFEKFN